MTTIQTNNAVSPEVDALMNPGKKAASQVEEAQNRFMTLLVTQMRNQDPLNPLDNAQVTSQMAQLSTVTGIDKLNATLETLMGNYQAAQSLQAANMIGHGVLAPGSSMTLSEGKAYFGIELAGPADKVTVTIRDGSGKAVEQIDVGAQEAGLLPLAWDGKTSSGATAANGKYSFEVEATQGANKVTATTLSFGAVTSVATGAQGVKLEVNGIGAVSMADVRQIL